MPEIHQQTQAYYDRIGARYLELFRDELAQKPFDCSFLRGFAAQLEPGARVLDAGCGPCVHVGELLRAEGLEVVGVDLSAVCLDLARQQAPAISRAVMDLGALGFAGEAFDGVVAYYSILYTPRAEVGKLFAEFHRVLKPGGRLLVAVKEGQDEGFIKDPLGSELQPYFAHFMEAEVYALLTTHGFSVTGAGVRQPYEGEIAERRVYLVGEKV